VLVDEHGEPTGYLHLKDVLDLDDDEYDEPVPPRRIRKLIAIAASTDIEDALATMRRTGLHVARVFDDSGATLGALFLEDIIEELVGEVQDATRRQP
jgi:CBS domain containing-hemolysin-like protein